MAPVGERIHDNGDRPLRSRSGGPCILVDVIPNTRMTFVNSESLVTPRAPARVSESEE
jgi:hypothetical protein